MNNLDKSVSVVRPEVSKGERLPFMLRYLSMNGSVYGLFTFFVRDHLPGGEESRCLKALSLLLIRVLPGKEGACAHDWTS